MHMRVRYKKQGGHIHCRVFTARGEGLTYANCGSLVFDEYEWNDVLITFECGGAEVISDDDPR